MAATLKSRLPEIEVELPAKVGAAVHAGAERLASEVRDRAPVGSQPLPPGREPGDLRDSIEAEQTSPQSSGIYAAFYWRFLEYGSAHAPTAQPFVRPSVEATAGEIIAGVQEALRGL